MRSSHVFSVRKTTIAVIMKTKKVLYRSKQTLVYPLHSPAIILLFAHSAWERVVL
jgi:hypothetical protein